MKTQKFIATVFVILFAYGCNNSASNSNVQEEFYPDGTLKLSVERDEQGRKHGLQKAYWENGNLKGEYEWNHGIAHGTIREYSENGKIAKVGRFSDGLQDSTVTNYYSDGQIESTSEYLGGQANGRCTFYYGDGTVKLLAAQENGKTTWFIHYDSLSGKIDDFHVIPVEFPPATISLDSSRSIRIPLADTALSKFFTLSRMDFYKNAQEMVNQNPSHSSSARVESGVFVFDFPEEIKPGKWILDIIFLSPQAIPGHAGFGVSHNVELIK